MMKHAWTPERIAQLSAQEIKHLRGNAERLHEYDLAALCDKALEAGPRALCAPRHGASPRIKARKLIARNRAFEARGVWLQDSRGSWSGMRKSDGAVVIALWADAIESADGACRCLLWRPNVDSERPWSDTPAGKERLEHCKRAVQLGGAEGLLVYGQSLAGRLPEDRAHSVHGADAETVIALRVEVRGRDYWAVWGKATEPVKF